MLAAALAFSASPALGQFRPEIPQWTEQGNAADQTGLELMYDFDWDVRQDDMEDVRWKPILMGAGIGFTVGFGIGWLKEGGGKFECVVVDFDSGDCLPGGFWDKPFAITVAGSLVGAGIRGAFGWLISRFGGATSD